MKFSKKSKSRHFILLLLLLFVPLNTFGQNRGEKTITIKILTYNIFHGATMNNDFDLDRIARVIDSLKPDIVALQEVDFKTNRARKMDLMTELGYLTGLSPLFGRAMYYDEGEYGEGILSRYSFVQTKRNLLPYSENHEPRAAIEVLIELPSGDTIRFVGTHLDHTKDPLDRINQCVEINRLYAENDYPTILAGDLNAIPDSKAINLLKKEWVISDNHSKPTFPSDKPERKIDYIMYRPKNQWKVLEHKIIQDSIASDHCAVFVTLELILKD